MKAKFNIGAMTVEVEGLPNEIAGIISRQTNQSRVEYKIAPQKKQLSRIPKSKKKGAKKKRAAGPRKNWTPEEDAKFVDYYNRKKTVKEMAELLKRSERSIYQHMILLREKGKIDAL